MTATAGLVCVALLATPARPPAGGKLQLEPPALKALREHSQRMKAAALANDATATLALTYAGVVKILGGPKKALQTLPIVPQKAPAYGARVSRSA